MTAYGSKSGPRPVYDASLDGVRASRGRRDQSALASEAGIGVLRDGGNAFDAAVATAAVLNIVEPTSTGLGGDLFALYRTADGDVGAFRSCGGAPGEATLERMRETIAAENGVTPENAEMPVYGPHTVTVPGNGAGLGANRQEARRTESGDGA